MAERRKKSALDDLAEEDVARNSDPRRSAPRPGADVLRYSMREIGGDGPRRFRLDAETMEGSTRSSTIPVEEASELHFFDDRARLLRPEEMLPSERNQDWGDARNSDPRRSAPRPGADPGRSFGLIAQRMGRRAGR